MRVKLHSFLIHGQQGCQHSLSIAMSTYPKMLEPLIGPNAQAILQELEEKFQQVNPHPKEDIGAIMYKSGQRSVVEWIAKRLEDE